MKINTYIIDAFTDQAFKGNPAGVCLIDNNISPSLMQSIAYELNLSETAFLIPDEHDKDKFKIRYFSPAVEVPFCGHATLASSKLVLEKLNRENVEFVTNNNLHINVKKIGNEILMKFPLFNTINYKPNKDLYNALGIDTPLDLRYSVDMEMIIIQISDVTFLKELKPDIARLKSTVASINAVVVTAKSEDNKYDFYSRCFAPWIGIDEDPVTGASHSILAKYWSDILDKIELTAFQCSKRGGFMKLKITGPSEIEVTSNAMIVFEGSLIINSH